MNQGPCFTDGVPAWPSGKAGEQKDLGSIALLLSSLFKRCGLWTLVM